MRTTTAKDISEALNARAAEVAMKLVPSGKAEGGKWVFGNASGKDGKSTMLNLTGQFVGKWRDWASDTDRGDLLDLWALTKSIPLVQAIQEAKDYLGMRDPEPINRKQYPAPPAKQTKALSPQGRALKWFQQQRGIIEETVEVFRVEGDDQNRVVFPSYSPFDVLINRSYRPLDSKDFQQDKGCAPSLFGWQAITQESKRAVILCEGQIDAMTWYQWGFDCLSVPNGAKNFNWIEYEWEHLEIYDTIYVSMDMDEQGREASSKIIDRLGIERCLEVVLPYKDANDCLMAGCTKADAAKWIAEAKPKRLEDLVTAIDLRDGLKSVYYPSDESSKLVFAPNILRGKGGNVQFRPGEVSAWTGYAGHGKTTLLTFLAGADIAVRDSVYFFASMEMLPKKILHKMSTAAIGVKPTMAEIDMFIDAIGTKLLFANVLGYIGEEKLFQMMLYCVRRYGLNAGVIDSFMAIEDLEEDYPRQGKFMSRACAFAKEHNIHLHIVCHPRKGDESNAPGMMDVKGGSVIINRADVTLVVQRNMEKTKLLEDNTPPEKLTEMTDTIVICRKDRETGWRGRIEMFFDWRTNTFSKVPFITNQPTPQQRPQPHNS